MQSQRRQLQLALHSCESPRSEFVEPPNVRGFRTYLTGISRHS